MKQSPLDEVLSVLPREMRLAVCAGGRMDAEELHLRAGRGLFVTELGAAETQIRLAGQPVEVTEDDLRLVIEIATCASYHIAIEKLCRGFLPLKGGHRLGLSGTAVIERGEIRAFRSLSSLTIRIAHEVHGAAQSVMELFPVGKATPSVLILSPPGYGKTTLLRDVLSTLSSRHHLRIGLADERGEVASLWKGVPQLNVGKNTDVMDGCPKAEGLLLLLRSMNPQLLAADEITAPEDIRALSIAANCGVPVIATAHGGSVAELQQRPLYRTLLEEHIFQTVILIAREGNRRSYRWEHLT